MTAKDDSLRMKQCPLCAAAYATENFVTIEQTDEAQLVHIQCSSCGAGLLCAMANSDLGMTSIATLTDLSPSDIQRLHGKAPLTDDDVLSLHQFLHNRTNAFVRLITT